MALFAYKGRDGRGNLVEGTLDGDDSVFIATQLTNTGITPVEITQFRGLIAGASIKTGWLKRRFTEKPVSPMDLMLFSRQMYTLLKAGVPIMRALAGLQESTHNPAFSRLLQDLRESLDSGRELSTALRRHPKVFSPFYVSMVQVGEMTGMLDETFIRLFDYLEFERYMRERIKSAMRYPSFVIIAMAIALVIINLFVIPAFAKVYAGFHAELPIITKMLIGFSGFMVEYWLLMLAVLVATVLGLRFYMRTPRMGATTGTDANSNFPIVGEIILKATLSRFARGLASRQSGVPIIAGLERGQPWSTMSSFAAASSRCATASSAAKASCGPSVAARVHSGGAADDRRRRGESGAMDGMMNEVADMYRAAKSNTSVSPSAQRSSPS